MTTKVFIDRSRVVERERCPRKRFLTYHQDGTGIVPAKTPLPLAVGGAVHAGLASLLMNYMNPDVPREEQAVAAALAEFAKYRAGLELDAGETAAMQPTAAAETFQAQVLAQARELGMDPAAIGQLGADPGAVRSEFDRYLWSEQSALVEALVRAYARRRLRPLLEEFEVLEVEREGEWKLSEWTDEDADGDRLYKVHCVNCGHVEPGVVDAHMWRMQPCRKCQHTTYLEPSMNELWFMSRPDALLRERRTNELYLLSYKTTAGWDVRKARDIEHDMQGLSEGVEVERRLGEWWQQMQDQESRMQMYNSARENNFTSRAMLDYLDALPAPPRIHAIRYEFLLKGERWKDKELTARMGVEVRSQKSHLIRRYEATSIPKKGEAGYHVGDQCWSWDYYRVEDDKESSLAWQNWKSRPVWEDGPGGVRDWIDRLDRSEPLMSGEDSTVGLAPRMLGWKSDAQALGVTKDHPLDAAFVPPIVVYRSDDQLRDWVETVEHAEREAAEHVAEVAAAADPGERRHLLNLYFPQYRHSCEYPSQCWATKICFAGADMQANPLEVGAGEYVRRVPNHPQELVQVTTK